MKTVVDRARFIRQLYNLRAVLEVYEGEDEDEDLVREWENDVDHHSLGTELKSFYFKVPKTGDKRKRPNTDVGSNGGAGGGAGDVGGGAGGAGVTDCAELRAHGYEVEPQGDIDGGGGVIMSFPGSRVRVLFLLMHHTDVRRVAASHPHRISAVEPEQEIHCEESSRGIE